MMRQLQSFSKKHTICQRCFDLCKNTQPILYVCSLQRMW
uniref:Uncharacterized protein n=1 Tax=Arundo donax TaxID=35708 RepID=A0A0A9GS84_ARUDO